MRAIRVALGMAVVVAGCDWRTFDDLAKTTPVASISAPSNYPAKDQFGSILLAVPPPKDGSSAGRFVATGVTAASVAVVSFDASGSPKAVGVTGSAIDQLKEGPISAIAEVPGERKVVMGAPWTTWGDVLMMELDKPNGDVLYPTTTFAPEVGDPGFGIGVGAGNIGMGAAPEIVVLSTSAVHVYVDEQTTNHLMRPTMGASDPCPIEFSTDLPDRDVVNRAVIVGSVLASGTQIAVGTPAVSGAGHVSIFDVDLTTGTFTCSATLSATEAHFGRAMTLVDLVGNDGKPDHLLVGAPPTHAYLYALPLSTGQAPVAMATETGATDFGAAVAAFNIDKNPGDEMFVGNPDASVGSTNNAGNVTVYAGTTMTKLASTVFPNPLAEHDPGAGHGYGSGIVGMTFCPVNMLAPGGADAGVVDGGVAACGPIPIIGALSNVFAYFTLNPPDPRLK
jgi:hypothetical protein